MWRFMQSVFFLWRYKKQLYVSSLMCIYWFSVSFSLLSFSVSLPSESRSILLPVVLHHIHLHLRQQRELLICSGILSSIFSIIKTSSMVQYMHTRHIWLKIPCDSHWISKYNISLLLTRHFSASFYLLSVSQESSVQEEVEMMVESLLDVLLQTLLSIMSKSHSVETSRGQRCPQCTAEITVSFQSTCVFDMQ